MITIVTANSILNCTEKLFHGKLAITLRFTQTIICSIFHFIAYYNQLLGLKPLYSGLYLGRNGCYRYLAAIGKITTAAMG
ncbi:hypothetical protein XSR1_10276 [Xenorhabdus szentirmaii DSM 16338]|uniref:Uncharacterized protein n=1 Tax=Xenorhabdus szentirmaii DSM 16338 TaxID=1427518 RepID=W1ISL9_9GAMM|nr:hypothetical protein XSR1_10276 [Xenorhabdus szentirmaii DSM 16338]